MADAVAAEDPRSELAALEDTAAAAKAALTEAKRAQRDEFHSPGRAVCAALIEYRDAINYHKPTAVPPDQRPAREAEITREICEAVQERGLVFAPHGEYGGLLVLDPRIDAAVEAANAALLRARRELRRFLRDNAEAIAAEERAEVMARLREALAGDDPEAVRDALPAPRKRVTTALTTEDLL